MSKHTKEPWEVWIEDELYIRSSDGKHFIGRCCASSDACAAADAARIVTCVNACAGLIPEAIPKLVEACEKFKGQGGMIYNKDWDMFFAVLESVKGDEQ